MRDSEDSPPYVCSATRISTYAATRRSSGFGAESEQAQSTSAATPKNTKRLKRLLPVF